MKAECYETYGQVFDYFYGDERLWPRPHKFARAVAKLLQAGDRILDVGGGTGLFSLCVLREGPDAHLTFVEPSPRMLAIAKDRLPGDCRLLPCTLDAAWSELGAEQFNVVMLMRSLYALAPTRGEYPQLLSRLHEHVAPRGCLCIMDFSGPVALSDDRKHRCREVKVASPADAAVLERNWHVLVAAFREFNQGIERGRYHVFQREELDPMLSKAGFEPRFHKSNPMSHGYMCFCRKA